MLQLHDVRVQRKRTEQRLPCAPFGAVDAVLLEMTVFRDGVFLCRLLYRGVSKAATGRKFLNKMSGYVMSRCVGERMCGEDRSAEALAG